MADTIRMVEYYYTMVSDKPGEGARLLGVLSDARVNLLAFSGFPSQRKSQVDFVPADPMAFLAAAKAARLKVSKAKQVFLIEGDDRPGALAGTLRKLAAVSVNVTAVDGVCAGMGRYGAMLWVKPRDLKKAAAALGVMAV